MSLDSAVFEPYPDAESVWSWFEQRYGIDPEVFAGQRLWHRPGAPALWIAGRGCLPPPGLRVEAMGMMALRDPPPRGKPTSSFLLAFGHYATRNVYTLSPEVALDFLEDRPVSVAPIDDGHGYCVVRTDDLMVGCGRLTREVDEEGRKGLICEVPRSWRESLAGWPGLQSGARGR